ncbi:UNVERIFIED_CONTAM: hypothetical protein FKN15_001820 [Acipenser sinensis]
MKDKLSDTTQKFYSSTSYQTSDGLPSGASSKGAPRGVQDVPYSLEIAGSNPGYVIADPDRGFLGGGAQLAEHCPARFQLVVVSAHEELGVYFDYFCINKSARKCFIVKFGVWVNNLEGGTVPNCGKAPHFATLVENAGINTPVDPERKNNGSRVEGTTGGNKKK